jgi:hypothetical protein
MRLSLISPLTLPPGLVWRWSIDPPGARPNLLSAGQAASTNFLSAASAFGAISVATTSRVLPLARKTNRSSDCTSASKTCPLPRPAQIRSIATSTLPRVATGISGPLRLRWLAQTVRQVQVQVHLRIDRSISAETDFPSARHNRPRTFETGRPPNREQLLRICGRARCTRYREFDVQPAIGALRRAACTAPCGVGLWPYIPVFRPSRARVLLQAHSWFVPFQRLPLTHPKHDHLVLGHFLHRPGNAADAVTRLPAAGKRHSISAEGRG